MSHRQAGIRYEDAAKIDIISESCKKMHKKISEAAL